MPRPGSARSGRARRCAAPGVRIRRPLTESRTPRAEPTSPTTSSGEATPTSSTKCTTGCSASWPSRCASRVLPSPPGAEDRDDPRLADQRRAGPRMSSSRPISEVDSWRSPSRTGLSAASSSACTAASAGSGVDARAGRRGRGAPARTGRAPRGCRARRPASAAGRRPSPRRRPRPPRAAGAPRGGRRGPTAARPSTAAASARSRRASSRRAASGPSPPDAGARAGQRPAGVVAGGHPVAAALGRGRRRDVVAQRERVDRGGVQAQAVAAPGALDHLGRGLRAGARDHDLQRLGGVGGWLVRPPHLVDERALADGAAVRPRRGPPAGRGCARRGPARRARSPPPRRCSSPTRGSRPSGWGCDIPPA